MIGRTGIVKLALVAVLTFVGLAGGVSHAAEDNTAQIEKLFREGVDLYQQGKYSEAQRKLREVLSLDPRKELAARLVDEAGVKVMTQMMANHRMGNEPSYIWQLYKKYYMQKLCDKKRMDAMALRLVDTATTEDERALLYREFAEMGHYAIPALAPLMRDAKEDYRTYSRIAIAQMGSRAVLPLIQLIAHKESLQREAALLTLGDIQPLDPRALPAIKARLEDVNETPVIKAMAARLIRKISGLAPEASKSSAEYYYDLANRYYLDRAGVAEEAEESDGIIWHLNEAGDLISVQYPLWAWSEQMAEDVVLQGNAINADYVAYYPLWACIHAHQFTHIKDLLDILNENPGRNSFSAEEKKEVENWDKKLVNARRLVAAVGKEHVNAALHKVHADLKKYPNHESLPQTGVFLASELAALDSRGELLTPPADVLIALKSGQEPVTVISPNTPVTVRSENGPVAITVKADAVEVVALPNNEKNAKGKKSETAPAAEVAVVSAAVKVSTSALVCGLDSSDESIQYACAVSLAKIDRFPCKWIGSEKVAKILGRGASEDKPLQVLLVEENTNKANELRQRIVDLGYGVTLAASARESLMLARSYPPKDIAVVSDSLRRDLTTEQLLEEMRADVRTRYLPVGILHLHDSQTAIKARFGSDIPLVEREMAGNDLKTAIEGVASKRAEQSVPKRKAHEVSVACSNALANVDARDTFLKLDDAVMNAVGALTNRPDDVRNPSAIFLGRVEGGTHKTEAAEALKKVILDGANAVELRRNSLRSIGRVQPVGLEELYVKCQSDADQEIKDIAAEAFGQTSRANKDINGLIRSQRIDKDAKEK